ncbi:hypothetical protein H2200_001959 [Cladophialophora chaetospira]|uniref:Uncharacterized protein n=1 Tax=Cladophialophora chaetospira TaxID=386627 RepID=A0AA38XLV1_9EURO|nr:hypothetical protein H2200_001959 [Cladophialophora chaetospira]
MARLGDLDDDILLLLPLATADVISMTTVASRFKDVFTSRLYMAASMQCDGYSSPETLLSRLRSLGRSLASNSHLVERLRRFSLVAGADFSRVWGAGHRDRDITEASERILAVVAKHLVRLTLDGIIFSNLCRVGDYPQLQDLKVLLCDERSKSAVLHMTGCPPRRSLELHDADHHDLEDCHDVWTLRPCDPVLDPAYRALTGREIVLNGLEPHVVQHGFESFLTASKGLEACIFIGDSAWCWSGDPSCSSRNNYLLALNNNQSMESLQAQEAQFRRCHMDSDIETLNTYLKLVEPTLEKLVIIRKHEERCHYRNKMLDSLVTFTSLRTLRIDDTYLLGNNKFCRVHAYLPADATNSRRPVDFAKLLPSSLERLDLHVSQGEIILNEDYCAQFLKGLFEERDRLQRLSQVSIEETPECFYWSPHGCDQCQPHTYQYKWLEETSITAEQIHQMQKDCTDFGIRLSYTKRGMAHEWGGRHFPDFVARLYEPLTPSRELKDRFQGKRKWVRVSSNYWQPYGDDPTWEG